jgi:predicted amidohydrolase
MSITAASIQMISEDGQYESNRRRAEKLILKAIDKKAKLILIPEFALIGYKFADEIWDMAEPLKGPTYKWLKAISKKHKVYIATCILEKEGKDFYDTFIMTGPGNDEFWSHRKIEPAWYESFFIKGGGISRNVFETPIGKIGVLICFDSSKTHSLKALQEGKPDLILIPFSYPQLSDFFPSGGRENWIEQYSKIPDFYSDFLGVPVITSNKTGVFSSPVPWNIPRTATTVFIDESRIIDIKSRINIKSGRGEQIITAKLGKNKKETSQQNNLPPGRWLPGYLRIVRFGAWYSCFTGKIRYRLSIKRRRSATGKSKLE